MDSRTGRGAYAPTWQEIAENEERENVARAWRVPPWQSLMAEGVHARAAFIQNPDAFARLYAPGKHARPLGTIVPPPPEAFTITNVQHFQFLRAVETIKTMAVHEAHFAASMAKSPAMMMAAKAMGNEFPMLLSAAEQRNVEDVVRAEQAHLLYHKAMWRGHGRRVLVLDPTTYTLLAHSDLPTFPARMLAAPWPSFYVQLPPRTFEFEVYDVRSKRIDKRYAEGVCVALDHPEPEYDGVRELAFMVMGEDEGMGSEGRNCAFAGVRFGPDATLNEFELNDALHMYDVGRPGGAGSVFTDHGTAYGASGYTGAHALRVEIPRVILGLMLYLASEHPDVIPVPPIERRTFADIRSPIQRERALANQAQKLRCATRLPVLVIGSRVDEHARVFAERLAEGERTRAPLDRTVYVRGHWHWYNVGPNRATRVHKWIRPYAYGPDFAESLTIKAARVPRAQLTTVAK